METQFKIAGYLDEAGETPEIACATLLQHDIHYIALRYAWAGTNICNTPDTACQKLKRMFNENNISVVAVISDLGKVEWHDLNHIKEDHIDRAFNVATYYQAAYIRVGVGLKSASKREIDRSAVSEWINLITTKCINYNITPLFEPTNDASLIQPADIATMLSKNQRWKLLYDPAQFLLKRNVNPFTVYWTLLQKYVAAIDVRDFKIGKGYKPPGFGDTKLTETLSDAKRSFKGWLFMEPSLGRRYGTALSKSETFGLAMEGLQYIIR